MKKKFNIHLSVKGKKVEVKEEINEYDKWINGDSKNRDLAIDFQMYCIKNPGQRFWQALRNWSNSSKILSQKYEIVNDKTITEDTFYWEDRTGYKN